MRGGKVVTNTYTVTCSSITRFRCLLHVLVNHKGVRAMSEGQKWALKSRPSTCFRAKLALIYLHIYSSGPMINCRCLFCSCLCKNYPFFFLSCHFLPHPLIFQIKTLSAQARKLSMTLKFLPITFTKSKENSTIFLKKYVASNNSRRTTTVREKH